MDACVAFPVEHISAAADTNHSGQVEMVQQNKR